MESLIFREGKIGNLVLRNRSIRAAAFEGMCPGNIVSDDLINYHESVSAGGIGMTTVAYAAVSETGLSFPHQLLMSHNAVPGLKKLTDAIHRHGAAASIQLGHCGQMADVKIAGKCLAPTGGFNLYGPSWPKSMTHEDIHEIVADFGRAAQLAYNSGFDAVEVHAGHGYLISQFLSEHVNKRKDLYGGSFENRCRFMVEVISEVLETVGKRIPVVVKMNLTDGFKGGMQIDEAIQVARLLESEGVNALVLSGGFVSRAPMQVMRGSMPVKIMAEDMQNPWLKIGVRLFGGLMIKSVPFREAYFLEDALKIKESVKSIPLIYVGGVKSLATIDCVMNHGFEFIQLARALIHDPAFINKIRAGEYSESGCLTTNYCIARMYSGKMCCFRADERTPANWARRFL